MKNNQVKFEYYKTNKGNVVINVESPKLGFSIHGEPEAAIVLYEQFQNILQNFPKSEEFKDMKHALIEKEVEEEIENESE
jgi:hypothetical protein